MPGCRAYFAHVLSVLVILSIGASSGFAASPDPFAIDYYDRLGVSRTATIADIHAGARTSLKLIEEDTRRSEGERHAAHTSVVKAWETLSNDSDRQEYDLKRDQEVASAAVENARVNASPANVSVQIQVERGTAPKPLGFHDGSLEDLKQESSDYGLIELLNQRRYRWLSLNFKGTEVSEREDLLDFVHTADDWELLFAKPEKKLRSMELAALAVRHIDLYMSLDHTPQQARRIAEWLYLYAPVEGPYARKSITVVSRFLETPEDYLAFHTMRMIGPHGIGGLNEPLEMFWSLDPTIDETLRLIWQFKHDTDGWQKSLFEPHVLTMLGGLDYEIRRGALRARVIKSADDVIRLAGTAGFIQYAARANWLWKEIIEAFFARVNSSADTLEFLEVINHAFRESMTLSPYEKEALYTQIINHLETRKEFRALRLPSIHHQSPAFREFLVSHHLHHPRWYRTPLVCHRAILILL